MNIEDIKCTSLELSKQLKEAGYKQEGLWWWIESFNKGLKFLCIKIGDKYYKISGQSFDESFLIRNAWNIFVAPTVAELGEKLPHHFKSYWIDNKEHTWACFDGRITNSISPEYIASANTEANARTKMMLWGLENGIWKFVNGELVII